jgi:hypothetical protein
MNSVISAATIEARNSEWDVLGIMDGFQHLLDSRSRPPRTKEPDVPRQELKVRLIAGSEVTFMATPSPGGRSVGVHDAEGVGKRPVRLGNKMLSCRT